MNKLIFCTIFSFSLSVTAVFGQTTKSQPLTLEEAMSEVEDVYEVGADEEIDNFDFLYNGKESFKYDRTMVDNLMNEAYKHLGARYRLGSKGPNAFDCSGFTSYVYRQNNMNIGNSSRDQYARNIPVKRSEMQPGDLVFFTSPRSGRGVGHVGIVIDYDPVTQVFTFIHASTKDGVKVSKSTDGYYSRRFVGVRRVQ